MNLLGWNRKLPTGDALEKEAEKLGVSHHEIYKGGAEGHTILDEPELQRRYLAAKADQRNGWLWLLALVSAFASALSAAAALNLHHTAALALVGWYLMMPPSVPAPGGMLQYEANLPLGRWNTEQSFDTAAECQAFLTGKRKGAFAKAETLPKERATSLKSLMEAVSCVASDDPRLVGR